MEKILLFCFLKFFMKSLKPPVQSVDNFYEMIIMLDNLTF